MAWSDPEYRKRWLEKNKEKVRAYQNAYQREMTRKYRLLVPAKAVGRPRKDGMDINIDPWFNEDEVNLSVGKGMIKRYEWDRT